jgi:hypothetical protein
VVDVISGSGFGSRGKLNEEECMTREGKVSRFLGAGDDLPTTGSHRFFSGRSAGANLCSHGTTRGGPRFLLFREVNTVQKRKDAGLGVNLNLR